jgi:predicted glycoside hydrolase/deacetylase ChbG (UPF0249 family)
LPRRLIITADDYGLTAAVNRGIEACVRAGALRSVCVMTNMPHWLEVGRLARAHPEVSIGIHWTVTQGRPVLQAGAVSSLLDARGEFLSQREFRRRFRAGGIAEDQLAAELAAQVSRLVEVGPNVAYWNTHQNIHVTPGLYGLFARIGRALRIGAMRSHRPILLREGRPNLPFYLRHPVFWVKGTVLARWARHEARQGTAMPAGRLVHVRPSPMNVELLKGTNWAGIAELVTHPADSLDGLESLTTMLQSRLDEWALFSAPDVAKRLGDSGVEPVSFAAVMPGAGASFRPSEGQPSN